MPKKILIIDGKSIEREELKDILQDSYTILEAADGRTGYQLLRENLRELAAVYLRLELDGISGADIVRQVSDKGIIARIPFIIIEGEDEPDTLDEWFERGVIDFERKPFRARMVRRRLRLAMYICSGKGRVVAQAPAKKQEAPATEVEKLLRQRDGLMEAIGTMVEYRNLEFSGHIRDVAKYTQILGMQLARDFPNLGLSEEKVNRIASMSKLHDVGKLCVPDTIMNKPGHLTPEEYQVFQSHTTKGCEVINGLADIFGDDLPLVLEIVRSHHERYDGAGYPDGLVGDKIPLSAQLVSLADTYDGLVSERSYKKAIDKEEAFARIIGGEEGVFNPKLIESFRHCKEELEKFVDQSGLELA